jgi:alpha-L-fucosidase 2
MVMIRNRLGMARVIVGLAVNIVLLTAAEETEPDPGRWTLWYSNPASEWTEALPVGTGRLGGMVFGGIEEEHIQFNEDSLWTGIPRDYSNPEAYEYLPEIRKLLFVGKQREAEELAARKFMSVPLRQERYQPFGDIRIRFTGLREEIRDYRRELDLDSAVARVTYLSGKTKLTRAVFASFPDQVLVIRLASDTPAQLNATVTLTSPHPESRVEAGADTVSVTGRVSDYLSRREEEARPSILRFESRLLMNMTGN